jgi:4a-hydroxytetrahydrobiopterin dehydratase
MTTLAERPILSYKESETPLPDHKIEYFLDGLPEWKIVEREGIPRLEKSFSFEDFMSAVEFTNLVAEIAEEADHHPAILVSWGRVAVSWWTHVFKRLHENDFIMAARTEVLYQKRS